MGSLRGFLLVGSALVVFYLFMAGHYQLFEQLVFILFAASAVLMLAAAWVDRRP
jgi:hypothetical protein